MARIRSLHPGFFTDENLVETSLAARMLFLGLGVEADDKGIFEWKPTTLKMKIFPADNIDVAACLAELASANAVMAYEIAGRKYGAIRNFRRFQRPKTPNDVHPITPEVGRYIGIAEASSETDGPKPAPFPPKPEKSPQMEEGGGNRRREKKDRGAGAPAEMAFVGRVIRLDVRAFERWRKAYHRIPDLSAELTKADDYYNENPIDDGKWFFPVSRWLDRAHTAAATPAAKRNWRDDPIYRNVLVQ